MRSKKKKRTPCEKNLDPDAKCSKKLLKKDKYLDNPYKFRNESYSREKK